jgi:hypothetical protein
LASPGFTRSTMPTLPRDKADPKADHRFISARDEHCGEYPIILSVAFDASASALMYSISKAVPTSIDGLCQGSMFPSMKPIV